MGTTPQQAANPETEEAAIMIWREVRSTGGLLAVYRAKMPGGWLVYVGNGYHHHGGVTFFPDPNHTWNGATLP
jgi:hypothetical protein